MSTVDEKVYDILRCSRATEQEKQPEERRKKRHDPTTISDIAPPAIGKVPAKKKTKK